MLDNKSLAAIIIAVTVGSSLIYFVLNQEVTSESFAEQIISECDTDVDCAIDYLKEITEREEQSVVLLTFQDLISKYERSISYCHPNVHQLSMYLYDYIDDLHQALSYADQTCGAAIYHGLLIEYFMKNFSQMDPAEIDVTEICPENANPYAIERWQCIHGLGHGLTISYDYDVFSALERCKEFEPGLEQISCSKGIFMENMVHYTKTGEGSFEEDDLFYPCNALDNEYGPTCYHRQATYIILKNDLSIDDSFQDCDIIIPEEFVKYCYYGIGRQVSSTVLDNMELSLILCQVGQPSYQSYCFTGLLMTLVNNRDLDQGFEYCKILPGEFKADCYDRMGQWIRMLHDTDEERNEECSKSENSDFSEICMNASLEGITIL